MNMANIDEKDKGTGAIYGNLGSMPDEPMIDASGAEAAPDDPRIGLVSVTLPLMGCNPELVKLPKEQRGPLGLEPLEGPLHLATLWGTFDGITEAKELKIGAGKDPSNITYGITGTFEGKNIVTGQIYFGPIFYLPSGFHKYALQRAQILEQGEVQDFVWHFFATAAANPRGYSWLLKSGLPQETGPNDPLARLRQRALSASGRIQLASGPSAPRLPGPSA
jgi:hypothetical protein